MEYTIRNGPIKPIWTQKAMCQIVSEIKPSLLVYIQNFEVPPQVFRHHFAYSRFSQNVIHTFCIHDSRMISHGFQRRNVEQHEEITQYMFDLWDQDMNCFYEIFSFIGQQTSLSNPSLASANKMDWHRKSNVWSTVGVYRSQNLSSVRVRKGCRKFIISPS